MASNSEEESTAGRRTRSGRKTQSCQPIASPVRPTRRTSKKLTEQTNELEHRLDSILSEDLPATSEAPVESQTDIIQEMLAEAAHGIIPNQIEENVSETSNKVEDLVEEAVKDNDDCIIYEGTVNPQQVDDVEMFDTPEDDQEQGNIETAPILTAAIDDKSSSFPFGNIVQSETSEDIQNEDMGENIDEEAGSLVESSLLASLAGDNANSLPSVGGGEEVDNKKDDFEEKAVEMQCNASLEKMESDDSLSEPALAEEIVGEGLDASNATIVNTEMVSEDELPVLTKPEINDAEEVSDDELPAPQRAELPADAEVISEDELPATNVDKKSPYSSPKIKNTERKKRKADDVLSDIEKHDDKFNKGSSGDTNEDINEQYNPMSPTGESNESPPTEKKAKILEEEESTNDHKEKKRESREKEKERKKLPDLDKYWRSVKEDPADFTGWTYLLQYVDNESDAEAAREAYDAFLSHYPYCYGYWRKYADYEKRKGIKANCNTVFERGLEAIPLSVDLWIHYLSHVKSNHSEDEKYIRSQFERAIESCGLEFRSDKLWDAYIKWENDNKLYDRVVHIYDRLLAIPTQGYSGHFDNFQDFINQHTIVNTISQEELVKILAEVRDTLSSRASKSKERRIESKEKDQMDSKTVEKEKEGKDEEKEFEHSNEIVDPVSEEVFIQKEDKVKGHLSDLTTLTENEMSAIKDRVISTRRKVHKNTVAAVTARWTYEEGIKRPYFHVKPLERCQLKNWKEYLDFEIEKGDRKRILVLFERCLIACALYDEFWLKMIRYLETLLDDQPDIAALTSDVYRRACQIHHPDKPSLHLMWSAFEECQNNFNKAADVLVNIEKKCPSLLQVAYRRINLERRRGDINKCKELYEHYIVSAKNKTIAGSLAIKYARFLNKICHDIDAGLRALRQTLEKDPANTRVALQMIDLSLQRSKVDEDEVVLIMDKFMARENIDPEQKVLFAQRKVEFLEDFGSSAKGLQDAQRGLQIALNKANEAKKKRESSPSRKSSSAVIKDTMSSSLAQSSAYNNGVPSTNANYNYNSANSAYSAYGQNNNAAYQQSYDGYYNQWQYGSGYGGYSQWSGYGNYY